MRFYSVNYVPFSSIDINKEKVSNWYGLKPKNEGFLWGSHLVSSEDYLWSGSYHRYKNDLYIPEWLIWDIEWTEPSEPENIKISSYDIDINSGEVLVIDSIDKLQNIKNRYPYRSEFGCGNRLLIDWVRLSKDYKAVYMVYHKLMNGLELLSDDYIDIRSYDCDTTMVFDKSIMSGIVEQDSSMVSVLIEFYKRYGVKRGGDYNE
jgi:hypothetical protein